MASSKAVVKKTNGGGALPAIVKEAAILDVDQASLTQQLAEVFAGSMSEFDLQRIRVPGGGATSWKVPTIEGDKNVDEVHGILLSSVMRRSWWQTAFEDSGGGNPPDCSSDDAVLGFGNLPEEVLKSKGWTKEQGDAGGQGFECNSCPFAQFGSDRKGRRAQDCKQTRPMFFLPLNGVIPAVIVVPPGSLKSAQQWLLHLLNARVGKHEIVTKFTLQEVPGTPPYAQIQFAPAAKPMEKALIPKDSELAKRILVMQKVVNEKILPTFDIQAEDVSQGA